MIRASIPKTCHPAAYGAEPLGPRIFVFGSARSGTTLLLNMFHTFDGVIVRDGEHCLSTLLDDSSTEWIVAKRTPHCADHLLSDLSNFRDVWILDIIRDPRDVVTSVLPPWPGYYCDFSRWARDVQVAASLRGRHLRLLHIRFEELVAKSDEIQRELALILGLTIRRPFSAFSTAVPDDLSFQARVALGGVRPLTLDRVGRWRRDRESRVRVADQLRTYPSMELLLQAVGYDPTDLEGAV